MRIQRLAVTALWIFALSFLVGSADANAATVLVLSTGYAAEDMAIKSALEAGGHQVTIGPSYSTFDGTGLSTYDTVVLVPNYNYGAGDMPAAGQNALLDFANSGHGLVTGEWTVWIRGSSARLVIVSDAVPVVATNLYRTVASVTYTSVTPDDTLNLGVDPSFTFAADSISGAETRFAAKDGATTFYGSDYPGGFDGVTGWNYGLGRVISFSTVLGLMELADSNYGTLVANAVTWSASPQ